MSELSRETIESTFTSLRVLARLKGNWGEAPLSIIDTLKDHALRALSQPPDSEAERLLRELVECRNWHVGKAGLPMNAKQEQIYTAKLNQESRFDAAWDAARAHLARQPAAQSERRKGERRTPKVESRFHSRPANQQRRVSKADRRQPAAREPEGQWVRKEPKPGLLCGDVAISTDPRYAGWIFVRHVDGENWTTGAKLTPETWAMLRASEPTEKGKKS